MDVRIEGLHERLLLRLAESNGEKTGAAMVRILIRDAAKDAGLWPAVASEAVDTDEPMIAGGPLAR